MTTERACPGCGVVKEVEAGYYRKVYKNGSGRKDGYHSRCKECLKQARRKARTCVGCGSVYFHAGSRGSRRRCCDDCATTGRVCAGCDTYKPLERFYQRSNYCKDGCALAVNRRTLYGIDRKQYSEMHAEVAGACPACGRDDRPLVVDHCHDSGAIRGLLCGPCNSGMGMFGDSVEAMRGAVAYLERFSTSRV